MTTKDVRKIQVDEYGFTTCGKTPLGKGFERARLCMLPNDSLARRSVPIRVPLLPLLPFEILVRFRLICRDFDFQSRVFGSSFRPMIAQYGATRAEESALSTRSRARSRSLGVEKCSWFRVSHPYRRPSAVGVGTAPLRFRLWLASFHAAETRPIDRRALRQRCDLWDLHDRHPKRIATRRKGRSGYRCQASGRSVHRKR